MCLMACYWARIPRLIFGASSHDVATYGFEDLQFYREAAQPIERRSLREETTDGVLRDQAVEVLRRWADMLPSPVEPKFWRKPDVESHLMLDESVPGVA